MNCANRRLNGGARRRTAMPRQRRQECRVSSRPLPAGVTAPARLPRLTRFQYLITGLLEAKLIELLMLESIRRRRTGRRRMPMLGYESGEFASPADDSFTDSE